MEYKVVERKAPNREKVEVLGETYEEGKPDSDDLGEWRQKLTNRNERLKYLQTGERYLYGKDWYGSEKRKRPA
jgi:hypothetical protein